MAPAPHPGDAPRASAPEDSPEQRDASETDPLSTAGELVQAGGNRAALGILTYLVIGTAFWGLIGFLLDYLVGTQWMVYAGAGLGLAAGLALSYLRLQAGLRISEDPQDHGAARKRRDAPYHSETHRSWDGGSRKDRQ